MRPVADLIRFVVGPEGEAVPDIKSRLPGRGLWVTATREAIEDAVKRKAFARGFKRDIRLPADLAARTEQLLLQAAVDALAMAGKAKLVAAGFTRAAAALDREQAVALFHAAEASREGVRKLDAIIARHPGRSVPVIEFLATAQLDLALGRPNVVHAALLAGPASDALLSRARRFQRFRTGFAGDRGNQAGSGAEHRARRLHGCV
ncbi:MAG: RNA-binding protein [Xanthobacteraceae bacterium]